MTNYQHEVGNTKSGDVIQNVPVLYMPQLEDDHLATQKVLCTMPILHQSEYGPFKSADMATSNIGQMIKNNPNICHQALELSGVIEKMVSLPSRHNSIYGVDDLNAGMVRAAMLNCSIGGCANSQRATMIINGDTSNRNTPTDRWFAAALANTNVNDAVASGNHVALHSGRQS